MIRLSMTRKQFACWLGTLTTLPVLLFAMGGFFAATIYSHTPQSLITSPLSDATITDDAAVEQSPISIVTQAELAPGLPERPISTNTELAMIDFKAIETGTYAVQIGSFSEEKNAQVIAQKLEVDGYSVATRVVRDPGTRKNQYKVRVGYYRSRDEADVAAKRYREEARSPAFVIPPSLSQGISTQNVEPLPG